MLPSGIRALPPSQSGTIPLAEDQTANHPSTIQFSHPPPMTGHSSDKNFLCTHCFALPLQADPLPDQDKGVRSSSPQTYPPVAKTRFLPLRFHGYIKQNLFSLPRWL